MRGRVTIVNVIAITFVLSVAVRTVSGADVPAGAQVTPPPPVLKLNQLTNKQAKALQDTAVIELRDGTRTTAGQLRAIIWQKHNADLALAQTHAADAQAKFAAYRAKFLQEQLAKLDAENTKRQAEFARRQQLQRNVLTASPLTVQQEAIQLIQRAKTASPAEQVQIEQRAGQLLQQLQQVPK